MAKPRKLSSKRAQLHGTAPQDDAAAQPTDANLANSHTLAVAPALLPLLQATGRNTRSGAKNAIRNTPSNLQGRPAQERNVPPYKRLPPISTLPYDVLREVFTVVHHNISEPPDSPEHFKEKMSVARTLSHVCGRWRILALDMSLLWATILITDRPFQAAHLLPFIQRSATRPLHVLFLVNRPLSMKATRLLVDHANRWRVVRMRSRRVKGLIRVLTLLDQEFPQLQTLELHVNASRWSDDEAAIPPGFRAPRLRSLLLRNAPPPGSTWVFPELEEFSINGSTVWQYFDHDAIAGLSRITAAAPNLRVLSIIDDYWAPFRGGRPEIGHDVLMSALVDLSLDLHPKDRYKVLYSLNAPRLHTLEFVVHDNYKDEAGTILPPLHTVTTKFPAFKHFKRA